MTLQLKLKAKTNLEKLFIIHTFEILDEQVKPEKISLLDIFHASLYRGSHNKYCCCFQIEHRKGYNDYRLWVKKNQSNIKDSIYLDMKERLIYFEDPEDAFKFSIEFGEVLIAR